jgi:hypothetical protein
MARLRVISDNDYAGDPDGLFQLAHLLLSPSVEVRGVIGSHLRPGDPFDPSDDTATHGREAAETVVGLLGLTGRVRVVEGSNRPLRDRASPESSEAAALIVEEAMRDDARPLFAVFGGGLTELASAYLIEPEIAGRFTAVWIGGPEHPGTMPAPPRPEGPDPSEYNLRIDIAAAQVVFDSTIRLWQVPRNAYRQVLLSFAEIETRVRPCGEIGAHLAEHVRRIADLAGDAGMDIGEAYGLGDSPLVLLTALQAAFEPDPSSSRSMELPAPAIDDEGRYIVRTGRRPIRVWTALDTRLVLEDLFAKLALAGRSLA